MLLGYSFEPTPNSRVQKRVWRERTRLTSPEVWAAANSKVWRDWGRASFYPPHSRRQKWVLLAGFPYIHRVVNVYSEITNTYISKGFWNPLTNRQNIFPFLIGLKSQGSFVITSHGWPRKDFFKYFIIDVNCWASTSYILCRGQAVFIMNWWSNMVIRASAGV